jgi:hypothetical protein
MAENPRREPEGEERTAELLDRLLQKRAAPSSQADGLVTDVSTRLTGNAPMVGECLRTDHPTLNGRALVRIPAAGTPDVEVWLPTLQGLAVRPGDRLIVVNPSNHPEAVVVGVLDGFALRPEPRRETAATITLQPDERVLVTAASGQDLLEVHLTGTGPVVRLLQPDVDLDIPGDLRVRAKAVRLEARMGKVELEAHDDVVLRGENVKLN